MLCTDPTLGGSRYDFGGITSSGCSVHWLRTADYYFKSFNEGKNITVDINTAGSCSRSSSSYKIVPH